MKAMVSSVGLLLLLEVVAAGITSAQTPDAAVKVMSLSVERAVDGVTVRIKTSGPPKYQSSLIDSPSRLVIDLPGATYAWNKTTLNSDSEPVRQVRGSQWKGSMARVVVELSRKVGYRIDKDSGGLSIVLEPAGTAQAEKPAKTRETTAKAPPAPAAAEAAAPRMETPRMEARAADPAKTEAALDREVMATVTPAPLPAVEPSAAPVPARIAQAGPAAPPPAPLPAPGPPPTPSGQAPLGDKVISLDFKDADVVNLLRSLAAESGRNIVVGEDVKGKVSVSLHNVTWEQALDTILEARGLQRLDRNGIIRIVSTDQLTKEHEAQSRVQEAQINAETEIRSKRAEAEMRETEAANKKFQSEANMADARARGPLREEAFRLSYADPGEIANTLQGILAFGQQASDIKPCRTVEKTKAGGGTTVKQGTGGGATSGPIAEPPFSQLFGPPRPPEQALPPPPPVPEDLVGKGLAIRTHCPTNTLFLRLHAADLERIKKLIKEQLDVPLAQVKIEARMEILDRSAFEGIGVQWGGAGAGNINNTTTLIGQGFQTTGAVAGTPVGVNFFNGFSTPNPNLTLSQLFPVSATTGLPLGGNLVNLPFGALPGAAAAGAPAGGISFGIVSNRFNINLALQALAAQGKTRTLARPEIVMVENTIGSISLGEKIPYVVVSSAGANTQLVDAALNLDVFPTVVREQIGPKIFNKIKMVVIVEDNSRGENTLAGPVINMRRAETQVVIKEGDRLVIGGVTKNLSSTTVRKVPLFGDIPILGWLFKQKENVETGRELVIFVTPSLVTGQGGAGMANTPIAPK
jgi:type IV pilus assembly protein PilQ